MSQFDLPVTKFHIICQTNIRAKGKAFTNPGYSVCSPVVFDENLGSGDFEHWLFVQPDPNVNNWGFRNVASGNWAAAQGGQVVACPTYDASTCNWLPITLSNGPFPTHHVQLVGTNKIWMGNNNRLAVVDAYEGMGPDSVFLFPADGIPWPPTN